MHVEQSNFFCKYGIFMRYLLANTVVLLCNPVNNSPRILNPSPLNFPKSIVQLRSDYTYSALHSVARVICRHFQHIASFIPSLFLTPRCLQCACKKLNRPPLDPTAVQNSASEACFPENKEKARKSRFCPNFKPLRKIFVINSIFRFVFLKKT